MRSENTAKSRRVSNAPTGRHAAKAPAKARVNMMSKSKSAKSSGRTARLASAFKTAAHRPRKPKNRENVKTALWLWCFPVGLSLMWRSACTWKRGVKIGITAAMVAILVAVMVVPTPKPALRATGVEMVAGKPEVEVYGPALPALIVPGYTREKTGSIIVDEVSTDAHYVYAADDARCYHEYDCKFAFASSQRLTVYEAYYLGYEPCGRCKPPVYTPGVTDPVTAEIIGGEASTGETDPSATEAAIS